MSKVKEFAEALSHFLGNAEGLYSKILTFDEERTKYKLLKVRFEEFPDELMPPTTPDGNSTTISERIRKQNDFLNFAWHHIKMDFKVVFDAIDRLKAIVYVPSHPISGLHPNEWYLSIRCDSEKLLNLIGGRSRKIFESSSYRFWNSTLTEARHRQIEELLARLDDRLIETENIPDEFAGNDGATPHSNGIKAVTELGGWLTRAKVAQIMGVSRGEVTRMVQKGHLTVQKDADGVERVDPGEVVRAIQRKQKSGEMADLREQKKTFLRR